MKRDWWRGRAAPQRLTVLYVMGPMTGLPDLNRPAFHQAADALRVAGYTVRNPVEIYTGESWMEAMRVDIRQLTYCTGVAALDGWTGSQGARLEALVAMRLSMPIRPVEWWLKAGRQ